jgi:hypothetical protein
MEPIPSAVAAMDFTRASWRGRVHWVTVIEIVAIVGITGVEVLTGSTREVSTSGWGWRRLEGERWAARRLAGNFPLNVHRRGAVRVRRALPLRVGEPGALPGGVCFRHSCPHLCAFFTSARLVTAGERRTK